MGFLGRFPSFNNLIVGTGRTFLRFPFTILCAITASVIGSMLLDIKDASDYHTLHKILVDTALGLPLFTLIVIVSEKRQLSNLHKLLLQLGGAMLLFAYFMSLPDKLMGVESTLIRTLLLGIGLHFAVAFAPWVGEKQINGFWQYNKSLFLRFLIAGLYSTVMYIGLVIALASADHLFGFHIDDTRYMQLWVCVAATFQTWIFLAGLPDNYEQLDSETSYPTGLKVFTQYILLPLVALYFLILFSYEAKIVFTWNWPKGWVSQLVLWFSVVGILSLLLLHPLKERTGNRWIKVFTQWFFRALIPLVIMLCLAIFRRISDYGVTEPRYFVLVMALALVVVVLYFVFSKSKDIRIIPIILCTIAFLSSFGPWGAFAVSERSQKSRLISILNDHDLVKDGKIQTSTDVLSFETRKEISSKVSYLNEWHGAEPFADVLLSDQSDSLVTLTKGERPAYIVDLMGFELIHHRRQIEVNYFSLTLRDDTAAMVTGYDHLIFYKANLNKVTSTNRRFVLNNTVCNVEYDDEDNRNALQLSLGEDSIGATEEAVLFLNDRLSELTEESSGSNRVLSEMTFDESSEKLDVRVILHQISGSRYPDSLVLNHFEAQILLRLK